MYADRKPGPCQKQHTELSPKKKDTVVLTRKDSAGQETGKGHGSLLNTETRLVVFAPNTMTVDR